MAGPLDALMPQPSGSADADASPVVCSRAGCPSVATAQVNWRNPRIHGIDRVKVWLACTEHRDYLADYLGSRDFPVEVTAVGVQVESVGVA